MVGEDVEELELSYILVEVYRLTATLKKPLAISAKVEIHILVT